MPTPEIREAARRYQERAQARSVDHAQTAAALLAEAGHPQAVEAQEVERAPVQSTGEPTACLLAAQAHATLALFWQREAHA